MVDLEEEFCEDGATYSSERSAFGVSEPFDEPSFLPPPIGAFPWFAGSNSGFLDSDLSSLGLLGSLGLFGSEGFEGSLGLLGSLGFSGSFGFCGLGISIFSFYTPGILLFFITVFPQ